MIDVNIKGVPYGIAAALSAQVKTHQEYAAAISGDRRG
jgi:NADP-dependent 3-hydroxy acid dehydrogenase YdfG